MSRLPTAILILPVVLLTTLGTVAVAWTAGIWLALFAALPLSHVALGLFNWLANRLVKPNRLPRLALRDGVTPTLATLVVVPCLLRQPGDVDALCESLLVRSLANRDPGLGFALLTDLGDAPSAELVSDAAILARAAQVISQLNDRHGRHFVLLHRPRLWNHAEGVWMGRERKRGKLEDLNRLLHTGARAPFSHLLGAEELLTGVQSVIVLDTDTRLPRDAARDLVATISHPLNRPRIDAASGLVTGGYGLIQPRVAISLASARRSWYASLWASEAGIDPYTRTVSDVYQDLFHAGSFIGKGIYDLAAFEAAVGGRFPEEAILSHDLLEGSYAGCGLASDILVIEDHPTRYLADVARRERWIRGDWQLLPWLGRAVPTPGGRRRNPLDALARWKVADNLRRSLVAPLALALLFASWTMGSPETAVTLSLGLLFAWLLPVLLGMLCALPPRPEVQLMPHLVRIARDGARGAVQIVYELAVLPFEAATWLDAICRTLWRLTVSRRRLLAWQTSTDAERLASGGFIAIMATMAIAPLCGLGALGLAALRPDLVPAIVPFALAWLAAPAVAWFLSRPRKAPDVVLDQADRRYVRSIARRTWRYFADHVSGAEAPLPPDNVQEQPVAAVARRTSPTNIGIALLAELAAHDLGWQTTSGMLDRIGRLLEATCALERYRGHLFNWYDTTSGKPLAPRYISMVDSGNLAGHLLVLAAGLRELAQRRPTLAERRRGVRTTLACSGSSEALGLAGSTADLPQLASGARALAQRLGGEPGAWCQLAADEAAAHAEELATQDAAGQTACGETLARQAIDLALGMEWEFLFERRSKLFAIGWQVEEARLDRSSYDLLASESRLGSYVAVAVGGIPQEHWFRLGRQQVRCAGGQTLVSWSGTLFEYLMPALVMPEEPGTLLDASNRAAVAEQRRYGSEQHVPWGISESAYHLTDAQLNWQYRAFGVPGLGLKRGLGDDLVIAPYATALALMIDAPAAAANFRRLGGLGAEGRYGFYEAIDFTTSRLPTGASHAVIRSWMAHHQGMSLLACLHVLEGAPMRRRFLADPRLQPHRLLLQERPAPLTPPTSAAPAESAETHATAEPSLRVISEPHPPPAGNPPAVEWALEPADRRFRIRPQPLARAGGLPLARGFDLRWRRTGPLPARCRGRLAVVGDRLSGQPPGGVV